MPVVGEKIPFLDRQRLDYDMLFPLAVHPNAAAAGALKGRYPTQSVLIFSPR
jgi:hypothetical protein